MVRKVYRSAEVVVEEYTSEVAEGNLVEVESQVEAHQLPTQPNRAEAEGVGRRFAEAGPGPPAEVERQVCARRSAEV